MSLSTVLTFARATAQTDSNGLSDANGIIFANEALLDFRRQLIKHGIDASSIQEAYRDASVPTAGNGSTFLYPSDFFFLKAIEVNYTDTSAQNYIKADQVDHANLPGGMSFSWLRQNENRTTPKFADNGDWYEVFPAFTSGDNLSQAIRIIYFQSPTQYTSTSDTIAYPESLGGDGLLGYRVAANYKRSLEDFASADSLDAQYLKKVDDLIKILSRGSQQPLQSTPIQLTGWEF